MQNFIFPVENLPSLADTNLFERGLEDWLKKAENSNDESLTNFITSLPKHKNNRKILKAVFGNSPYLTQSILKEPAFFKKILSIKPDVLFTNLIEDTRKTLKKETDLSSLMKKLRIFKRRAALLTALADISELWDIEKTTRAISDTADTALQIAVSYLLRTAAKKGEIVLRLPDNEEKDSGLIILGMGKLGAYELNYSSDIDIIVLYEAEKVEYIGKKDVRTFFIKLTRNLI
ncbi:MAG: glutamine-synthetase adenylyltransferase, partial [Alphaproteobacteria bacterium]|nr:glutamine-synthetase adenylyltransferase [Alphaproteobacteria bacterium]